MRKEWILTQEAFDGLLCRFDADREEAGKKYERIRLKLVRYFEWRQVASADGAADETINRVARKLAAGADIQNLNAYFYGVARMVSAELQRARERERAALNEAIATEPAQAEDDTDAAARRACLERCLTQLPDASRELIIEYYQDEKSIRIEHRKRLAARLNIPPNALRIRMHRLRTSLEACVRECVGRYA